MLAGNFDLRTNAVGIKIKQLCLVLVLFAGLEQRLFHANWS